MLKANIKGIAIGGLAAYLIIGKGFSLVNRTIDKLCDAAKWRSYYRHGKDGNMVPPGYASHTHPINDKEELTIEKEDPKPIVNSEKKAPLEGLGESLGKAIVDVIKDRFGSVEKPEEASEDETEASEQGDADDSEFVCSEMEHHITYMNNMDADGDGVFVESPEKED